MKDSDFKDAKPFLIGEEFRDKVKTKLEAAAALEKMVYLSSSKPRQFGFWPNHPWKTKRLS